MENGPAYLKALGNPEGPHALAADWVGTQLANAFGLSTLTYSLIRIDAHVDEVPFLKGGYAESGTAFCTREEAGHPWGGGIDELENLENPDDITRLVVFDTWIRNRDRCSPDPNRKPNRDNVFLSSRNALAGKYRLLAIDHTHCFGDGGTLSPRLSHIATVRDPGIFGLFPEFRPYIQTASVENCLKDLSQFSANQVREIVATIPADWSVNQETRDALCAFLTARIKFLASTCTDRIHSLLATPA